MVFVVVIQILNENLLLLYLIFILRFLCYRLLFESLWNYRILFKRLWNIDIVRNFAKIIKSMGTDLLRVIC
jgi:hypothetical protein